MASTKRKHPNGTVHEMADLGVGTLCGRDLPEPWEWTEEAVSCGNCAATLKRKRELAKREELAATREQAEVRTQQRAAYRDARHR